jgi:large subunit ribosomal protein L25
MSSVTFELDVEVREDIGKGASRRLRHANKVPAVVYGAGEAPVSLLLNHDKVSVALSHEAFYSHILTLNMGKKSEKVILKALQRHPSKARIQHMDFLRVKADQKLKMHIPLHFIGEESAPGVKEGGVVSHLMSDVEVSCLPANLPEYIEVDVSKLGLDQSIHLSDLKLAKGIELVAFAHDAEDHDQAVISIHLPRTEEEIVEVTDEAQSVESESADSAKAADAEGKE